MLATRMMVRLTKHMHASEASVLTHAKRYGRHWSWKSKNQMDTNIMPMETPRSIFTNTLIETMSKRCITKTPAQCQCRELQ